MPDFWDHIKRYVVRFIAENDPLLRKIWIRYEGKEAVIVYGFNINDEFRRPLLEVDRDLRILISVIKSLPKKRPVLSVWIYDRDPTVPYTQTVGEILVKAKGGRLVAIARVSLKLPDPSTIKYFNLFLLKLGIDQNLKIENLRKFLIRMYRLSLKKHCSKTIDVKSLKFVEKRRELVVFVEFEFSTKFSISNQFLEILNRIRNPYGTLHNMFLASTFLHVQDPSILL